jgi:hypothetical protein
VISVERYDTTGYLNRYVLDRVDFGLGLWKIGNWFMTVDQIRILVPE